jgi:hypothetical protein
MLAALALAYIVPFNLVLVAYAVLGPAHYLTEISWLHERSYFLPRRGLAVILTILTGCLVIAVSYKVSLVWLALLLWAAMVFSAAFGLVKRIQLQFLILGLGFYVGVIALRVNPKIALVAFLLPTLVHVSVFTFVFMLVGALRSKSPTQFLLVASYVTGLAVILAWPPTGTTEPQTMTTLTKYFGQVGDALGELFGRGKWPLDARLAGLLSFVYTYHYLNWFIKVKVINWHAVSKWRLCAIGALSLAATATYFYDYTLGFTVLLSLSLLHVMLEFPLNTISIRQLGSLLRPQRAA